MQGGAVPAGRQEEARSEAYSDVRCNDERRSQRRRWAFFSSLLVGFGGFDCKDLDVEDEGLAGHGVVEIEDHDLLFDLLHNSLDRLASLSLSHEPRADF